MMVVRKSSTGNTGSDLTLVNAGTTNTNDVGYDLRNNALSGTDAGGNSFTVSFSETTDDLANDGITIGADAPFLHCRCEGSRWYGCQFSGPI